jgi:hypothetical protein
MVQLYPLDNTTCGYPLTSFLTLQAFSDTCSQRCSISRLLP